MDFGQVLTAMVTPFDSNGELDLKAASELIDHLIATGTDALVVAGTTGESPTLSTKEKLELFQFAIDYTNKRVPVILGTGSNDTASSVALSKQAEVLGADGIMAVVPYYNRPNQSGMFAHFQQIATNVSLPVMLYNVPHRTGAHMLSETVIALSKLDNIIALKEASGDLEHMATIIDHTDEQFIVYSGDDSLTLPALSIGAHGVVSVASHVIGNQMKEMVNAFKSGETKRAATLHLSLLPKMKALFLSPNPVCVKHRLKKIGIDTGGTRLPLLSLTSEEQELVDSFFS
ncbi:4-hydroxy-tetrahydrodipicolinate synthase [Alkalicoccobacillus plakortidis]|uniref:4-hydroxy-tetrahydrodipicolinate synthase n=1 Tax=Alkalicoccobacillus plakortidis TaxID=444060 RepID=A0ABT0XFL2_9BACI|nr:4-hydroxy-tetrahydrodipicolinate synthase [Alkalicoccobacillus plakortidis]MCM2674690.1 4-hydroxy-tetrahydrodipicolinate synthase [Alkalicoccobacillus plakortidis]